MFIFINFIGINMISSPWLGINIFTTCLEKKIKPPFCCLPAQFFLESTFQLLYIPRTHLTLVLTGKDLVLEGSTTKIKDKQVPDIYIYIIYISYPLKAPPTFLKNPFRLPFLKRGIFGQVSGATLVRLDWTKSNSLGFCPTVPSVAGDTNHFTPPKPTVFVAATV